MVSGLALGLWSLLRYTGFATGWSLSIQGVGALGLGAEGLEI